MTLQKIAIITDSTNDLPLEILKEYDIRVVPLTLILDGQPYLDGVEIKPQDFYKRLLSEPGHPTTSQPTPADFLKAYQTAKDDGVKEIVVVTISSAMSGTLASAKTAAENFSLPIHFVDSLSNTMGLGWQVLACARARDVGEGIDGIISAADKVRANLHLHVSLDTLEYLFKGGRIAGAAKMVNNVLKIKPLIRVNHQTGSVEPVDISRTRIKALESLYNTMVKKLDCSRPLRIAILHNDVVEDIQPLLSRIRQELNPVELIVSITSPVLGAHTGPRAVGLCGYSE